MKTITLNGPIPALTALREVIQDYADVAYPVGGSECAQAARAGLLDVADKLSQQITNHQTQVIISRRIKSHLKAAIQYYLQVCIEQSSEIELAERRSRLLLSLLDGDSIQDDEWY